MVRFFLYRVLQVILAMWAAGSIAWFLGSVVGDPLNLLLPPAAGNAAIQEQAKQRFIDEYGLDKPLVVQYAIFLKDAATFDLPNSWQFRKPAFEVLFERVPASAKLAVAGLGFAVVVGLVLGVITAYWRNSWIDQLLSASVLIGQATPTFVIGIVLIQVVAVKWGWFPVGGIEGGWKAYVLPMMTLGLGLAAPIARLTRSSMITVFQQEYVRLLRLKGLSEGKILLKHVLRNASLPVATIIVFQLTLVVSGAVITETIFRWPGIGPLIVDAVKKRDYAIVEAAVLMGVLVIALVNLLLDVIYVILDPRVSYSRASA